MSSFAQVPQGRGFAPDTPESEKLSLSRPARKHIKTSLCNLLLFALIRCYSLIFSENL